MYSAVDPLLESSRRSSARSNSTTDSDNLKRYSLPVSPRSLDRQLPHHTRTPSRMSNSSLPTPELTVSGRAQSPAVAVAMGSALASPSEGGSWSFPPGIYRTPPPSRSQSRPAQASASPDPRSPALGRASLDGGARVPPSAESLAARERSYSPMAASFARLSRKDGLSGAGAGMPSGSPRGRSTGGKSRLELEASLFAGPA